MDFLGPQLTEMLETIWKYLPKILISFGILFFGWLAAKILQRASRAVLGKLGVDRWVSGKEKTKISETTSFLVFLLAMLFVIVAFLDYANLEIVAGPIEAFLNKLGSTLPNILGAVIIGVVAYFLGRIAQVAFVSIGERLGLDRFFKKMGIKTESGKTTPTQFAGNLLFFVVILFFLPAFLGYLKIDALRMPLQSLIEKVLEFGANLAGSLLIIAVAWFLGSLARSFVASLLTTINLDGFAEKIGFKVQGKKALSAWGGDVIFVLIVLFAIPPALANLNLPTLADPISGLVKRFLAYLPNIAAGLVILVLTWIVARVIAELLERFLNTIQFDAVTSKMGLSFVKDPNKLITGTITTITRVVIVLFGTLEALEVLKLEALAGLLLKAILYVPSIVGSIIILAAGLFLANAVSDLVARWSQSLGEQQGKMLAKVAYAAIIIFTLSVVLEQLSLGTEIVTSIIKITGLGLALAFALAFGLGGKDIVGSWLQKKFKK